MKLISKLFIAIAVLTIVGCSEKRHNYVVLIDNSKSITENLLEKYISLIQNTVLQNMGRKDRLTIQFIDECSLTKSERIYTLDLAEMDFTNITDGKIHEEDSSKARFIRVLNDSIKPLLRNILIAKRKERKDCGNYTDIISAVDESKLLITSEKSFSSNLDKVTNDAKGKDNYEYSNYLLIFSDMINEDRQKIYDFTKMGKMNEPEVSAKIKGLQDAGKIPDLKGVKVFVYGATSTKETGILANKQIENVKSFWEQYFKFSNAELKAYGYDSENELKEYLVSNAKQ